MSDLVIYAVIMSKALITSIGLYVIGWIVVSSIKALTTMHLIDKRFKK